jgi:hypothetical protein
MTTSYPPPPSRDPPPSLPRRRNDLRSTSPVSSSTSTRTGTPAMDPIRSKLPLRGTGQGNQSKETDHEEEGFDVIGYWAIASVCWYAIDATVCALGKSLISTSPTISHRLFVMAIPLLLFPRLLAFISQSPAPFQHLSTSSSSGSGKHSRGSHYDDLTPLEKVLAQQLGWGCVGVGVVLACIVSLASIVSARHMRNLLELLFHEFRLPVRSLRQPFPSNSPL